MVQNLVKELIVPKLKELAKKSKCKYEELLIPKGEHFQEYLERSYDKYSIINTLVFHNSQRKLKDIYVAQSLVRENGFEDDRESIKIDALPVTLIKKYKKILITDTAGMGKSTIMKRMFIDILENSQANVGIPIYIELNRLNKDRTILTEIQEELSSLSKEFDNDLLLKLIQTGGFVFFLDGYDEISVADRSKVTNNIQSFISKAGNKNYYFLTSRPEDGLSSFGDFQSFKIQALTKKEAFELLKKYDMTNEKNMSKKLIDLLKSGDYKSIDEYLENPLLVSLLYSAFNYKQTVPLKKHQFYRQVYDALYDAHKLAQGQHPHEKHSSLDIDDFSRILKYVGYECLIRIGVRFDKDTILKSIVKARSFYNLDFGESDFLEDLKIPVPLFVIEGPEFKWAHKSLMEYFAARFIADDAKENQDKILTAIYNSEHIDKYINMLDIYYDIDLKGFSKNITLPLFEQYLRFYKDNYYVSNIDKNLIEKRIARLFMGKFAVTKKDIVSFDVDYFRQLGWHYFEGYEYLTGSSTFWVEIEKVPLLSILYKKAPSLFYNSNHDKPVINKKERERIIHSIMLNKVLVVDVKTGEESEENYKAINSEMISFYNYCLDHIACSKEVDRIRKEIANNNESSLLAGI